MYTRQILRTTRRLHSFSYNRDDYACVSTQHTFATRVRVHRASNWTTAEGEPVKVWSGWFAKRSRRKHLLMPGDGARKENRKSRGSHGRTLLRAFLVQDAVAALATDDDVPGTKHDLRPAICSRDTRRGEGQGQPGNSRNPRVRGAGEPAGRGVRISPPQLYVTPAALAFWLYTSPPYMMLLTDEFQRFEARVGARTMWWLPPPPDRFRDGAKKNVKTTSSLRILGRGTAVEREATRARDGEG